MKNPKAKKKNIIEESIGQTATDHSVLFFLWDPGATQFPVLIMTAAAATELQDTDVYKAESTCSCEIQKLYSLVNLKKIILWPSWKLQLSTPFKLFMQLLCAKPAVQETKQIHHLVSLVKDEMLKNESEFTHEQLSYMLQGTSSSFEWVSHIVIIPSCWFPSFQWQSLLTEEKVMFGLIPEQWSFWCYATHYCQISEKCIAISSQLYWHEDINFNEKHLWLIKFQPP